jgi:hypothetical protein
LLSQATFLDRFYIPTRYPNGLPAGVPHVYFSEEDAITAIEAAREEIEVMQDSGDVKTALTERVVLARRTEEGGQKATDS